MTEPTTLKNSQPSTSDEQKELVQWREYARHYDEYVVPLTCYQDNISQLTDFICQYGLGESETICDLGAGTGIYISAMHKIIPKGQFIHVDSDSAMIDYAQSRYLKEGISVAVKQIEIEKLELPANSQDLVTAINVIYSLPDPLDRLQETFRAVKPGGYFFSIDFGRKQQPIDWTFYFFKEMVRREGLQKTLKSVPSAISLFKRQAEAAKAQTVGEYWLHSTETFRNAMEDVGFEVMEARSCYRGYADLAICRKPD